MSAAHRPPRGFPPRVAIAWLILLTTSPVTAGVVLAWFFYVRGNGFVPGAAALATVPVLLVLLPYLLAYPTRRWARVVVLPLLCGDATFASRRLAETVDGTPLRYCEDGVCDGVQAPLLSRIIREDETSYAGIALSGAIGLASSKEMRVVVPATHAVYQQLDARRGGPGPNGVALSSDAGHVRELVHMPPGDGPVPALIVLHGFGGLLTPLVDALAASPLGERYALVAPALDMPGYWWRQPGRDVLARTLETLPPRVDRDRLWLVGISNGAIGANHLGFDPEFHFRGTILLQGADALRSRDQPSGPVLLIPAIDDPRFPIAGIRGAAEQLRDAGAEVTLVEVPGDHFVLFTDPESVTWTMEQWLAAHE